MELAAGGATTLTFTDVGAPTPTVQWYYVAHGDYLKPDHLIPGATSTTLTLSSVTTAQDGNYYYAHVTNNPGQSIYATNTDVDTNAVTLKVDGAPVIYQQPQSVEVHVNDYYNLQSGAQGSPTATPQWQISTDGGTTWNNDSDNPGANSTTIAFPPAGPGDDGTLYRVIYTNTYGSTTSDAVVIHVDYQTITGNPNDVSVAAGQPASFSAAFAGYPAATVQWQSAPAGTTTFTDILGALSPTFTIANVDPSQSGMRYRAVFTQTGALDGTIVTPSNYATLTVTLASPTFGATASAGGAFGKNVTDSAFIAGGDSPTGTITFTLFGAGDSTCSAAALFTSVVAVSGNGNYGSPSYEPTGVGTYYWTAAYSGDARNNAALAACAAAGQSVTIAQAAQPIVFGALPQVAVSGTGNVTATGGGSNNAVTFSTNTSTICSVTAAGVVTGIAAGGCEVDAAQLGNANYLPGTASTTLQIAPATQTITFTSTPPVSPTTGGTYTVSASGGASGNPVTFSIDASSATGACSILASVVSFTGAGTCVVDANQAGNASYTDAAVAQQTMTVGKASSSVTLLSSANPSIYSQNVTLTATPVSGGGNPTGTVTFTDGVTPVCSDVAISSGSAVCSTSTLSVGSHSFVASYSGDTNNLASTSDALIQSVDSGYVALDPARLVDTRAGYTTIDGLFQGEGALPNTGQIDLSILGRGGVAADGVDAVVLNVTVTNPTGAGFVTVWPTGSARPNSSNLNYVAGNTVANLVVVKLGTDDKVSLFSRCGTDMIVDVVGYFVTGSDLTSFTPQRLLDTRVGYTTVDSLYAGGGSLGAGSVLTLPITGRGGVPVNADSVIFNLTATNPTAPGFVTVWSGDVERPKASTLNFVAGQTIPNLVVSKLSSTGTVSLFNNAGSTDLIADVTAWFPANADMTPITPARLLDTRVEANDTTVDGQSQGVGPLAAHTVFDLQVVGRGDVPPAGVSAVVLNVTVTNPAAPGFLQTWSSGSVRPAASNINYVAGQTIANLVIAKVGTNGKVSLFSKANTDAVVDVVGWLP